MSALPRYTPGPWRAAPIPSDKNNPAAPWLIFTQYKAANPAKVYGRSNEEREANAHLIAAAPDLFAACEAALAYDKAIQQHAAKGESWVDGDDLDELYSDWITKARAAIAKARGEAA